MEGFDSALGASYRLVERHGLGATGEVWRAVDRRTDEVVAAKLLRAEHVADRDLVSRFIRERSILTHLRHSNIVAVRDLVVEGDRLAIVMDFVDGGSLRDVLKDSGPLTPAQAVDVTAAVLDGLAAAHDQGVLHRDIKPDNVLLSSTWRNLEPGDLLLSDFGIASIVADRPGTTGLLGTPEYMSPELLASGDAGLPSDVYGVGILIYELLSGRTPFAGPGTDYTIAHRHLTSEVPGLEVPTSLWRVITTLLDKNPAARPTAATAAAQLRELRAELVSLPALPTQQNPDDFASARGPATVVRGLSTQAPAVEPVEESERIGLDAIDLGAPGQATTLRPMQRPQAPARAPSKEPEDPPKDRWAMLREPRLVGIVLGSLVLIAGAAWFVSRGGKDDGGSTGGGTSARATQQDQPLPTGLTVSRKADYNPDNGVVTYTISYAAQNAPLAGPFLEVIPGLSKGTCPGVEWDQGQGAANLPTTTGVSSSCAYAVTPAELAPQASETVSAKVNLGLPGKATEKALQDWLDEAAKATTAVVSDAQLTSTSYPVQRLRGIDVVAPDRTVSNRTLPLVLLPVWPNGSDKLNPLYKSPAVGQPTTMLSAIAGGDAGVKFSDGCSGALAVSGDGLVVTALTVAPDCKVNAQVGNFTQLTSNSFAIVTRGS